MEEGTIPREGGVDEWSGGVIGCPDFSLFPRPYREREKDTVPFVKQTNQLFQDICELFL